MKILSLGLDNSILNKTSALAERTVMYGELVEKYAVIVPDKKSEKIQLSEKVKACGSGGNNKLAQLIKIYCLAKKILSEEKYSVITVQDQYYLALIGLRLSKKVKVGLEIQVHGWEKYYGLRKLIAKYVLPRAGAVRCVNQRLKKRLVGEFNVMENKITVAPIFVDTALSLRSAGRRRRAGMERSGSADGLTVCSCRPNCGARLNHFTSATTSGRERRRPTGISTQACIGRSKFRGFPTRHSWVTARRPGT